MFRIKIGKFTTEIIIRPSAHEDFIKDILRGFLTTKKPDIVLRANLTDGLRYDDYKGPAPAVRTGLHTYEIKWYYFSGTFDLSSGSASAKINSRPYVLTSFLRMIYAIKIINSGGLFVHAASFVRDDRAYLFPGKSGAGKSTLSRIAASADPKISVLSDEISYISIERGKVFAYSTPFWGNTKIRGEYKKAPLSNIYFIRQAKKNYKKSTTRDEAIQNMLENMLYASVDNDSFGKAFDSMKKIIGKTENAFLYFTKDSKFLEVI